MKVLSLLDVIGKLVGGRKWPGLSASETARALGVALHAGDVGYAVVVEVGDHDVREHVIGVVDGEVDRLGVAKGAGGGVGPGGDGERDGGTVGGGICGGGVKGSGELVASGRKDVAQDGRSRREAGPGGANELEGLNFLGAVENIDHAEANWTG